MNWLNQYGLLLVVYCLATWFTNPWLMGDTVDYVNSIVAFDNGYNVQFWEFGHLFWRPLCWLIYKLFSPLTGQLFGADQTIKVTVTLLAINWIASLIVLLILHNLILRVCNRYWIVNLTTIGFLFSAAFLNYGQTGSAYVPGLALVLLAAYILVLDAERSGKALRAGILAGILLASAVCLWFPFALLIPVGLTMPFFLLGWDVKRVRTVVYAVVAFILFTSVAYGAVVLHLRFRSLPEIMAWITAASHGMNRMRGVPRMIFGFSNSLVDLSGDGALFKRYLRHDPFNPVSISDVVRFSLWKLAFSYLFLFAVLINLLRSDKRIRILGLLLVNIVPTIIFALFIFEAGDTSRYLGILPVIFLAVAVSMCGNGSFSWATALTVVFIGFSIVNNIGAMDASTLEKRQQRVAARVNALVPLLKPQSRVVTSHLQDELNNFTRDFPFNPINREGNLRYYALLAINTSQVDRWREDFAKMAMSVWDKGGDVWLSRRLFKPRPLPDWGWVEGEDPRVSWSDLYSLFSEFEVGQSVGDEDGFVLLLPSEKNRLLLSTIARKAEKTNNSSP
jgi:hypothetical protein